MEYLFHRYVLHGRFPPGKGLIRRFLHERLDPLNWEHHERPFDGWHITGELKDILPLFFVAAPFSFLFPVYALPVLLAGVVQGYVSGEWLHYFLHFGKSRNRYFRPSSDTTCTTIARAEWKRVTASRVGFGILCSIRSIHNPFLNRSPEAIVAVFLSER